MKLIIIIYLVLLLVLQRAVALPVPRLIDCDDVQHGYGTSSCSHIHRRAPMEPMKATAAKSTTKIAKGKSTATSKDPFVMYQPNSKTFSRQREPLNTKIESTRLAGTEHPKGKTKTREDYEGRSASPTVDSDASPHSEKLAEPANKPKKRKKLLPPPPRAHTNPGGESLAVVPGASGHVHSLLPSGLPPELSRTNVLFQQNEQQKQAASHSSLSVAPTQQYPTTTAGDGSHFQLNVPSMQISQPFAPPSGHADLSKFRGSPTIALPKKRKVSAAMVPYYDVHTTHSEEHLPPWSKVFGPVHDLGSLPPVHDLESLPPVPPELLRAGQPQRAHKQRKRKQLTGDSSLQVAPARQQPTITAGHGSHLQHNVPSMQSAVPPAWHADSSEFHQPPILPSVPNLSSSQPAHYPPPPTVHPGFPEFHEPHNIALPNVPNFNLQPTHHLPPLIKQSEFHEPSDMLLPPPRISSTMRNTRGSMPAQPVAPADNRQDGTVTRNLVSLVKTHDLRPTGGYLPSRPSDS